MEINEKVAAAYERTFNAEMALYVVALSHRDGPPCFCDACNRFAWALERGRIALAKSQDSGQKMPNLYQLDI